MFSILIGNTLQGTNISHLGKRKIIFKSALLWDMLVPRRVKPWICFLLSIVSCCIFSQHQRLRHFWCRICLLQDLWFPIQMITLLYRTSVAAWDIAYKNGCRTWMIVSSKSSKAMTWPTCFFFISSTWNGPFGDTDIRTLNIKVLLQLYELVNR